MKVTLEMDRKGNLQIPPQVRRAAGLSAGVPILCTVNDGVVRLETTPAAGRIKRRKDGGKVFTGSVPDVDVVAVLAAVRLGHGKPE